MNNHEWLEVAKEKINGLSPGTIFEVKNLFDSIAWDNLLPKERQGFGRYFSTAFNDGQLVSIHRVDDGKRKPNRYVKE